MFSFNHAINFPTLPPQNIISTSSIYRHLTASKQQQQTRRRRRTTTTTTTTITSTATTISLFSLNTTIIPPSSFSSTSSTQQQVSFEEHYSAKTGIKTAALLGGMLLLVVIYLMWKARARLCRSARYSANGMSARPSATKFDLDYWLKQVDLLENKEAERNRGDQQLYLELPLQEPRDSEQATAAWIVDAWRQWRLIQYRQQQQLFEPTNTTRTDLSSPPVPYRRRRFMVRRLFRRILTSPHQNRSFLMDNSSSVIAGMRPSSASITQMPPPLMLDVQHRRAASWPHIRPSHHQTGMSMSALQTHLARQRLLKRTSRTTFDT